MLSALLSYMLCENVGTYHPLLKKLTEKSRRVMDRVLGEEYTKHLSSRCSQQELPDFHFRLTVRKRESAVTIERSLRDLSVQHVQK